MDKVLRIGTRESQLAVWQANKVKDLLAATNDLAELVFIKSEGDIDLQTPLYEIGVQGIFTRSLDIALLNGRIDLAVHSMKDVPTQLPNGIVQAAVLKRASYKDLLVYKGNTHELQEKLGIINGQWVTGNIGWGDGNGQGEIGSIELAKGSLIGSAFTNQNSPFKIHPSHRLPFTIATSSVRRQAQWLNRYPGHLVENLRGNVNTRLRKVAESTWNGAIFAAAGLERINLRPENAIELDWMLPAPAQGAIVVLCRAEDEHIFAACQPFNDAITALCTHIEKSFLRTLMGGCSTPVSALAEVVNDIIIFRGNIFSIDGTRRVDVQKKVHLDAAANLGENAAMEVLANGGQAIADTIHHAK